MALNTKGRIVSIVINNEFIKMCEVTKKGKNITIHKDVTVMTPAESYFDGAILDINALSKTIRDALNERGITAESVVFSVTSTKIATKEVLIPNIKTNKIEGLIQANATEYFPVNIDEYIIQHSLLEKVDVDGVHKLKVLVMAAPAKMIEQYYQLAERLGVKIECIDYIGNSTSKAISRQIGNETSVVIQIENDSTIVNFFQNRVLQLQRTIPYGKSILVNALVERDKSDYYAALEKLEAYELLHTSFDGDKLTENLQYLVSSINRVIDYYVSRNNDIVIEKGYIIGAATHIKGFLRLMCNELNMLLNNITEFKDVIVDKRGRVNMALLTSYVSNMGALIEPVNFVPKLLVEKDKKKNTGIFYVLALICSIIIAVSLIAVPMVGLFSAKETKQSLQVEVDNLKDIEAVVNEYYSAKDMAAEADEFAALTANKDDSLQDFIKTLEVKMPTDMKVTSMSVSSGAVTISGTASSKSSIAELIEQLNTEKFIAGVNVASETETKDNAGNIMVTFSMTCVFTNVTE